MSQQQLDYFSPPAGSTRTPLRRGAVTIGTIGAVVAINCALLALARLNGTIAFYLDAYVARDVNIGLAILSLAPLPWVWKRSGALFTAIHIVCAAIVPFLATHALVAMCDRILPRC